MPIDFTASSVEEGGFNKASVDVSGEERHPYLITHRPLITRKWEKSGG